jgi:hypothetical protein
LEIGQRGEGAQDCVGDDTSSTLLKRPQIEHSIEGSQA